jgi:rhamnogalacturonan hydrolase
MTLIALILPLVSLLFQQAHGQLIGPVGPTTPLSEKTYECNVLNYGAVADNATDISAALNLAFESCVLKHPGSRLVVPAGNYLLNESVVLTNGTNWAFQLDGLITANYGGNWTVDRGLILQGFAGVTLLNDTINGEGDQQFLLDVIVVVNGSSHSNPMVTVLTK